MITKYSDVLFRISICIIEVIFFYYDIEIYLHKSGILNDVVFILHYYTILNIKEFGFYIKKMHNIGHTYFYTYNILYLLKDRVLIP